MRTRLLALFTALALVAGACSSDSDDSAEDADAPSTTEASGGETSGDSSTTAEGKTSTFGEVVPALDEPVRFEGAMRLVGTPGSQLTEPVEILVAGSLDPERDASSITMDMSSIAQAALGGEGDAELPDAFTGLFDEPLEIISIDGTSWMKFPLLTMLTGVETEWVEVPPDETGALTSGLGLGSNVTSPTGLLEQLREAEVQAEEVGTETIRGTETTHYRLQVDASQLAEELPAEDQAQLEAELGGLDQPLPVEVWVDDEGRLHRYTVDLAGAAEEDPDVESATIEFEFFDHGAEVDIEAPPPDEVTPIGDLAGLLGGGDPAEGGGEGGEGTEGGD